MRIEAIAAMGVWPDPSPMDRVDGIYLGQAKPRSAADAQAAILRLMQASSTENAPALKVALAEAAGRLDVQAAAPVLLAQLRSDPSFNVRAASLRALQALKVSNMDEVMKIAVADADANVRRAALGILPSLPLSDAAKVQNLSAVIRGGAVNDQQAGFEVLGTLKSGEAEKALASFFDELVAGKVAPAVQLDLVDAMQANGSPALMARLEAYQKSKSAHEPGRSRSARRSLQGGNPGRGRETFVENAAAQCTRCHTVRNAGSDVGPNLTGVATRLTREQILESLLEPSARVAPGYGTVGITLQERQARGRHAARRDADRRRRLDRDATGRSADREVGDRGANQPGLRDAARRPHRQAARSARSRGVSFDAEVGRAQGSRLKAQGSGLRAQGSKLRAQARAC